MWDWSRKMSTLPSSIAFLSKTGSSTSLWGHDPHLSPHLIPRRTLHSSPADSPQGLPLRGRHNLCLDVDAEVELQGEALLAGVLGGGDSHSPRGPSLLPAGRAAAPGRGAGALRPCACAEPSSWAASAPSSSAPCGHRAGRVMGCLGWGRGGERTGPRAHPLVSADPSSSSSSSTSEAGLVRGGHDRVDMLRARIEPENGHGALSCAGTAAPRQRRPRPAATAGPRQPQGGSGASRTRPRSPCGSRSKRMWPSKCMVPWRRPSQSSHRLRGPPRLSCRHSAW